MKPDSETELGVKDELMCDPDLDATDISVSVNNGVVTLAAFAWSYTERYEAEAEVVTDIEVRVLSVDERPDPEIARDAVNAIRSQLPISGDNFKVMVQNGYVTLKSEVGWQYQRAPGEHAVRRIKGVKGVITTSSSSRTPSLTRSRGRSRRRSGATPRSMQTVSAWKPMVA